MPNWCICELTVSGPKKVLDEFVKQAKQVKTKDSNKSEFSLAKFVPIPKKEEANWYDWCVENWGTKWDLDGADCDRPSDKQVKYGFHSAWSPPLEALDKIAELFPKLKLEIIYDEPGMCFEGERVWENGAVIEDGFSQNEDYTGILCGPPDAEDEDDNGDDDQGNSLPDPPKAKPAKKKAKAKK